jgi:hypothetical protein
MVTHEQVIVVLMVEKMDFKLMMIIEISTIMQTIVLKYDLSQSN